MVLTWIGLLVLSIIAAPLTPRRLALVWTMAGLFLLALLVPASQTFFALDPPDDLIWLAAFGIAALVWSFARLFVPGERPVGPRAATSVGQTTDGGDGQRSVKQAEPRRRPQRDERLADDLVDRNEPQTEA